MKKFIEYSKQNGILHMAYTNEKGEEVFRTCANFRGFVATETNLWINIELEDSWTIAKDLDEAFEMFKDFSSKFK